MRHKFNSKITNHIYLKGKIFIVVRSAHLSKGYIMLDKIDSFIDSFDNIIRHKHIRTVFQPILSLRDGSVLGHEALSRISVKSNIDST